MFDTSQSNPQLNYQISFQIQVTSRGTQIFRIVVEEGASMSTMSLSCWKDFGSLELVASPTFFKSFNGHHFNIHGIISSFWIEIGCKLVTIHIEVVDAHLDYNILLGGNWSYAMQDVISSIFSVIHFPH